MKGSLKSSSILQNSSSALVRICSGSVVAFTSKVYPIRDLDNFTTLSLAPLFNFLFKFKFTYMWFCKGPSKTTGCFATGTEYARNNLSGISKLIPFHWRNRFDASTSSTPKRVVKWQFASFLARLNLWRSRSEKLKYISSSGLLFIVGQGNRPHLMTLHKTLTTMRGVLKNV